MLTVWSSSSSSAGSGIASSPKNRERASNESSSFENAGLQREGMGNRRAVSTGGMGLRLQLPVPGSATSGKPSTLLL